MTTVLTFGEVQAAFERCYTHLRDVNKETAPNSYTWYAETLQALAEETEREFGRTSEQEAVAYVYECNGGSLTAITPDWSVEGVEDFFWSCFGFEESFPREDVA